MSPAPPASAQLPSSCGRSRRPAPLAAHPACPRSAPVRTGDPPPRPPQSPAALSTQVQPTLTPTSHVRGAGSSAREACAVVRRAGAPDAGTARGPRPRPWFLPRRERPGSARLRPSGAEGQRGTGRQSRDDAGRDTETWLGAPRIPEDLPLGLGRNRSRRKPAGPALCGRASPQTARLGPGPALPALPHAGGLASSRGCRGPPRGTLPLCWPQLHGSGSAKPAAAGHVHKVPTPDAELTDPGSRSSATEERTERAQSPESPNVQAGRAPLARHCPAASGHAWTAPLPQPSLRPPALLCGPGWSLLEPLSPQQPAKPPSQLLRGAGAGLAGPGGAPSPAEPPARL